MTVASAFADMSADPAMRRRGISAAMTFVIEGVIIALMLFGTEAATRPTADETLKTFDVAPPVPPPERVKPKPARSHRREGRASPPNLRSKAAEIVAPVPILPVIVPPPVIVAKVAGLGAEATSGAAPVAGPGTGAGGVGNGTGSGGAGDGDGDGGEGTPPRWRKGRLKDSDYPKEAGEAGVSGTVTVRYLVMEDGHVSDCEIIKSSGNGALDETTCRLIRERFRFDASRDAAGRPVPAYLRENHSWAIEDDPTPSRK
jgi:periplasmic protein TonB